MWKWLPLGSRAFLFSCLFILSCVSRAEEAGDLYYAASRPFAEPKSFELRLGTGYDFSNPYLNVLAFSASAYWLAGDDIAIGLEGAVFSTKKRGSTEVLEAELSPFNYQLKALAPEYSTVAIFRYTPVSGLVNLFSRKVIMADIHLLGRAGAVSYETQGLRPLLGLGFEVQLGFTPMWGMSVGMQWDAENVPKSDWQWRNGFRIGPTLRF